MRGVPHQCEEADSDLVRCSEEVIGRKQADRREILTLSAFCGRYSSVVSDHDHDIISDSTYFGINLHVIMGLSYISSCSRVNSVLTLSLPADPPFPEGLESFNDIL